MRNIPFVQQKTLFNLTVWNKRFFIGYKNPVYFNFQISKLRKELRVANYTIAQLREKSEEDLVIKESSLPIPDYPEATAYYNSSSKNQIGQLVTRFGELFIFASNVRHCDINLYTNRLISGTTGFTWYSAGNGGGRRLASCFWAWNSDNDLQCGQGTHWR